MVRYAPSRVLVRRVERRDQDEFLQLARASAAFHYPRIFPPRTADEFDAYLNRFDGVTAVGFVVCLRRSGTIVGYISISQIVRDPYQRGVLGFGSFVPHARRGYMIEGLRLVICHAFDTMGLRRLEADIEPANEASRNLVKRLDFRREGLSPGFIKVEGTWRDFERWALTQRNDPSSRV